MESISKKEAQCNDLGKILSLSVLPENENTKHVAERPLDKEICMNVNTYFSGTPGGKVPLWTEEEGDEKE